MGIFKKKFRDIKKFPDWIYWFPAMLMRLWFRIMYKVERIDTANMSELAEGMIGLAWHNRLLFFPVAFKKRMRQRCAAVVSASRDGQYVADFIKQFGISSLRGSSSRKGANALLGAIHAIEAKKNVVFTPDGPRGPRYTLKPGPVMLASKTGAKVIPVAINASKYWECKGWDGFQIPKPGAKITVIIGEPIAVPPGLDSDGIEEWRCRLENVMRELNVDQNTGA